MMYLYLIIYFIILKIPVIIPVWHELCAYLSREPAVRANLAGDNMTTKYLLALIIILVWLTSMSALATNLNGNLTADNSFIAYISTSDDLSGIKIGNGDYWGNTYSLNSTEFIIFV